MKDKEQEKPKLKKRIRRFLRKITKKENIFKIIIVVSGIALILTSILPYII